MNRQDIRRVLMGIYTDVIQKKEENLAALEHYADESLMLNKQMYSIEDEVEDAQTAVLYILDKFGIKANRVYGQVKVSSMIETLLDPLGMMYDYTESVEKYISRETEYILAFREDGKSVILYPSVTGYRYYCPSDTGTGYATRKFCGNLRDGCYIFHRPLREKKSLTGTLIYNVLTSLTLRDILLLIIATAAATGLGLVVPQVSRWIYKEFLGDGGGLMSGFRLAILIFTTASLIRAALSAVKSLMLSGIGIRISTKMQSAVMAKVLGVPQSFFSETSSGKLSRRISNSGRLAGLILSIFWDVLLNFAFSVVYLFQMKSFVPVLVLPALIFTVLRILASVLSAFSFAVNEAKSVEADMENNSLLYSSVKGIQRIKSMGAEIAVYAKWADIYRRILAAAYDQPFFLKYNSEIMSVISTGATIVLLAVCMQAGVSSEDYLSFTASYSLLISVVSSLSDMMQNVVQMKVLCDNVRPIFDAKIEQDESTEYIQRLKGNIKMDNVRFSYESESKDCLNGITLEIKKGEKVAIVGESGCGKSTLLKIIIGMEKPREGMIYYDNKPLNSLNLKSLRRKIGSVFQFSKVLPGTIAENVTFGAGAKIEENEIWDALDKAAIGDEIRALPLRLDTEISESISGGFSGGQRQRILIARALIRHPKVLILDEATSALDNLTQNLVLDHIRTLDSTVIMVAHRLSTVAGFDRIVMLENGIVAEEGSYEALMEKNGKFSQLVRKQVV